MSEMEFTCGQCGASIIGDVNPGDQALCPYCNETTEVPQKAIQRIPPKPVTFKTGPQGVVITGIDIKFWNLVGLMVYIAIAAIPAAIIVGLVYMVVIGIMGGILSV